MRILCVDDSEDVCELLVTMLGRSDLEAVAAHDAAAALRLMEAERFSLYIIDGRLPGAGNPFGIVPDPGESLEAFQACVYTLREYECAGLVILFYEDRESRSGRRHVERVRLELTKHGVTEFGGNG